MATAAPAAYLSQPTMPDDDPYPQQPAAASGGKAARAGKRGRFGSRRRVEEAEQRQTSAAGAAVAQPQNTRERAAAARTQRAAAESVSLRSNVDMLSERVEKLDKNVESLQVQLEAERVRSRAKDAAVKEIRAAAHTEDAPRAAIKERTLLRAFGMMRRPNTKRIKPPPVLNGSEYRGFKRREIAKLKAYLDRRYEANGSTAFKLGHQGAVLAILNPLLMRVAKSGCVLEGWAVNSIHNAVKIMLYEGQYKHAQFINEMEAIKDQLMEIVYGLGMKLHGEVYTFKLVLGGDMAFHGGIFGHAGAASTFFCFICDMPSQYMHHTPSDYERKGMTKPITKSIGYAAMMTHAMGKENGLEEPHLCPSCGENIHRIFPHGDSKEDMHDYQWAHFGQRQKCPPGFMRIEPEDMIGDTMHARMH
eukprot:jgi/Tetstr1/426360/TSEL_016672.t1